DRVGIVPPVVIGALALGAGYAAASYAPDLWTFALSYGLVIGLVGSAAMFGPLIADTSLWFDRYRGVAIALCASGNYIAGTVWPPIIEHFIATVGWRQTHVGIGL